MQARSIILTSLAGLGLTVASDAQLASYTELSQVSGINDITPDGQTIVGSMRDPNAQYSGYLGGFIWRWKIDPAPTYIGGRGAVAISDDGQIVAGNTVDPITDKQVAGIWTEATGWIPIVGPESCDFSISSVRDISGDGLVVTGFHWRFCRGRAFRWTQAGGIEELELITNDFEGLGLGRNVAAVVAEDGRAFGWAQQASRVPAMWLPDGTGQMMFSATDYGEVFGMSADEDMVVGSKNGEAFYSDFAGTHETIGKLNTGDPIWNGRGVGVTIDGNRIVGRDTAGLGSQAWIWTRGEEIQSLRDTLEAYGATGLPQGELFAVDAITPNGAVIVGNQPFGDPWVATLPPAPTVAVYGCGFNPQGSLTIVDGSPGLGVRTTFGVDNPLGSQTTGTTIPFLSIAGAPDFNFPCGTPVPGFGMDPSNGYVGELLIRIAPSPPFRTKQGPTWAGPGNPAEIGIKIPDDTSLLGLTFYAQGAMLDFNPAAVLPVGLTNAALMFVGL